MDQLPAFKNKPDNHLRSRLRSPDGPVRKPHIADFSSNHNLNLLGREAQKLVPICDEFYRPGHYSTECRKNIFYFAEIISNYESLKANDKAGVPDKNDHLACQVIRPDSAVPINNQDSHTSNLTPTPSSTTLP